MSGKRLGILIAFALLATLFCPLALWAADDDEPVAAVPSTHEVRAGETLASIAATYNVDENELAVLNNVIGPLTPGQVLVIPEALQEDASLSLSLEGSRINIDIRDVDIRDVLTAIAVSTNTNIIYKGGGTRISLLLENVTPLAVIDAITWQAGLAYLRRDGKIYIASQGDLDTSFGETSSASVIVTSMHLKYMPAWQIDRVSTFFDANISLLYKEGVGQTLWLKGTLQEIEEFQSFMKQVDVPDALLAGTYEFVDRLKVINMDYLTATTFNQIIGNLGFLNGFVIGTAESMSLYYSGTDDDFAAVQRLKEIVDVKQSSTTVKRIVDSSTDEEAYTHLQIRRDFISEMTGISAARFFISSNISKSGGTQYVMYLRGTPEEVEQVLAVVSSMGG